MTTVTNLPTYKLQHPEVAQRQSPSYESDPGDSSLATEILPEPPPLSSVHQAAMRRDSRKPSTLPSFLPQHDPGTTYTGIQAGPSVGSVEAEPEVDGPRRKRARVDKSTVVQHARSISSRSVDGASLLPVRLMSTLGTGDINRDSDDIGRFRLNSVSFGDDDVNGSNITKSQHSKGKEKVALSIKEEPSPVTLHIGDSMSAIRNEDHCSACRSLGSLVYCDGCPCAYHLWCLDPPMEASDLPEGETQWYCPKCKARERPSIKPHNSLLSSLINQIHHAPPVEFQLPEEIRSFFRQVGTSVRGTYMDSSLFKTPRVNRHGELEDRDPYRMKDRNGLPVLCFRCGASALPDGVSKVIATRRFRSSPTRSHGGTEEQWNSIISCDYCTLHWHLDCLDPPLLAMPPFDKKWMCPNHAETTLGPKSRLPKHSSIPIDVAHLNEPNNGNIEITAPDRIPTNGVTVDEIFINGRRYRVPESVLKLDFWGKISRESNQFTVQIFDNTSGISSPLTPLTSLDGDALDTCTHQGPQCGLRDITSWNVEDVRSALLLLDMSKAFDTSAVRFVASQRTSRQKSVQTDARVNISALPEVPIEVAFQGEEKSPSPVVFHSGDIGTPRSRKQPYRASKRDVSYVIPSLDVADPASNEDQRSPAMPAPINVKLKQTAQPRQTMRQGAPLPIPSAKPPFGPLLPASSPMESPAQTSAVASTTPMSSSSLKIRLPPRPNISSAPNLGEHVVQGYTASVKARPNRRSLRRQAIPSSTTKDEIAGQDS